MNDDNFLNFFKLINKWGEMSDSGFFMIWIIFPEIQFIVIFIVIVYALFTKNIIIGNQFVLAYIYSFTSTYAKYCKDVFSNFSVSDVIIKSGEIHGVFFQTFASNFIVILLFFFIVQQIIIKAIKINS